MPEPLDRFRYRQRFVAFRHPASPPATSTGHDPGKEPALSSALWSIRHARSRTGKIAGDLLTACRKLGVDLQNDLSHFPEVIYRYFARAIR